MRHYISRLRQVGGNVSTRIRHEVSRTRNRENTASAGRITDTSAIHANAIPTEALTLRAATQDAVSARTLITIHTHETAFTIALGTTFAQILLTPFHLLLLLANPALFSRATAAMQYVASICRRHNCRRFHTHRYLSPHVIVTRHTMLPETHCALLPGTTGKTCGSCRGRHDPSASERILLLARGLPPATRNGQATRAAVGSACGGRRARGTVRGRNWTLTAKVVHAARVVERDVPHTIRRG